MFADIPQPPAIIITAIKPAALEFGYGRVLWYTTNQRLMRVRTTKRPRAFRIVWTVKNGWCQRKVYEDLSGSVPWVHGTLCIRFYPADW